MKIKIGFLFLFILSLSLVAQEDGGYYVSRDLSTWTTASFQYKANKKLSFTLSEQFRFQKNSTELDAFFTQFKVQYKLPYQFKIGGAYRFIADKTNNTGVIDWEQRFHFDLSYSFDWKRFDFDLRLRGQSRDDLGEKRVEDGDYARRALRFRFETEYDIKKWKLDPVFSAEIFRENGKYVQANFNKFRTTLGTSYQFKTAGTISMFYRFERDLNTLYPLNHSVIGLKYKFNYKHKK